ncbi:hypothetical protein GCM10011331_13920 [Flavimobilis marinus]|uniref:Type I restriction modification DNA specificity domain-containing protein n=1 Tax=Flavimobilis marinus TaxID=285351 RepID=A0A1I2FWP2_9MICO|nr:restriction endonuclease subunit S [Flavimobilis marinus]GHG50878.1 hypothetical protein GCM10011331_13920 [Flavimobilis marinus]SFF09775.1 Type I restriction modification DNA specificity domain-containing protein [Flavimobilis marinus]
MTKWRVVPVASVAKQRREAVRLEPGVEYTTMGVRWHGKGAYNRGIGTTDTVKAKTLYRARSGDFVFNRIDTQKGAFDVVPDSLDGALASNEFPLYETDRDLLLPQFLLIYFKQSAVLRAIEASRGGSEGRARWKERDFESWSVPLPDLGIQRRIVDLITSVDRCVSALDKESGGSGSHLGSLIGFRAALTTSLLNQETEIPESYDDLLGEAS